MKNLFLILFCASSFATSIGDFAPLNLGSIWKYSYVEGNFSLLFPYRETRDSLLIEIELLSKQIRQNDTLILLQVSENGRSISTQYLQSEIKDTLFNTSKTASFIDTIINSGDSIYRSGSYRSKIFPFWNSHHIDSSLLQKGLFGFDSLYFYSKFDGFSRSHYLQNTGLDSIKFSLAGNTCMYYSIKLIDFYANLTIVNDHFSFKTTLNPNEFSVFVTSNNFMTIFTGVNKSCLVDAKVFDLSGRLVFNQSLPAGNRQLQIKLPGYLKGAFVVMVTSGKEMLQKTIVLR